MYATAAARPASLARRRTLELSLCLFAALAIVLIFWSEQRYPALLKKLHAGQGLQAKGQISFDAVLPVTPAMTAGDRIARTSVNWLWTNRFGMIFALPFGAAMMTLLTRSSAPRAFSNSAGNVLCGAVAGAPMGVCTNCATPIAQGLLDSGASTRMTLAGMISSPSFNPVVIAMTFALFPAPLAWARMAAPALLLAVLPFLVAERPRLGLAVDIPEPAEAVRHRLRVLLQSFGRNLLRLTWMTLPWMLLSAVLGAALAQLIPAFGTRVPVSILGVVAVALFGTFLPVPMAFDVALAFLLYRSGVATPYVAALLCTLGPVSIYSLSALSRQVGRSVSLRLAAATTILGCIAGWLILLRPMVR